MKNFIVLLALVSFAFIAKASDELNYVSVGDVTYFSDEVKVGSHNVRIATDNGLILKAPLKDVDAYMVNGRIYERMPLVCKDGKEKCTELMELVSHRNGLRLYKCYSHTNNSNLGCCFYDKEFKEAMFFVYKEGKLYLRIDKENAETVLPFFRVDFKGSN